MRYLTEIGGYLGMFFLQGATIPATLDIIEGTATNIPPYTMVFCIWFGLILYLIRSIARKDHLYTISNGIGVILNSVLLYVMP